MANTRMDAANSRLAQMLVGLWLIIGLAERTAVFIATSWMLILIVLVARGNPSMLTDPYGALVKDLCLIACAITEHARRVRYPSALPHLHDKFEDKPEPEKLCQQSRIHLHGHVTAILERN